MPTEESLSRECSANCAKCLQKVAVRYKRSPGLCNLEEKKLIYPGDFRGKQGQKPDGQGLKRGGSQETGTEAELRRRERRKNWGRRGRGYRFQKGVVSTERDRRKIAEGGRCLRDLQPRAGRRGPSRTGRLWKRQVEQRECTSEERCPGSRK